MAPVTVEDQLLIKT